MLSKMFCLNKSIIKSDLKRFWYLAVLNTLITFFSGTFAVMESYFLRGYRQIRYENLPDDYYVAMVCGMGFALLTTVCVFSYLNKSNQVAFSHAFPIKRRCQYLSHLTSVVILTLFSGVINSVILFLYTCNDNVSRLIDKSVALEFFIIYMAYSLLIMALTTFTQMLTGLSSACVILTGCFVAIPFAFEAFLEFFLDSHIYGYFSKDTYFVTRLLYLPFESILSWKILIYASLIAVLLILGYLLYKFRKLECNGEVVAYTKMRPIFIYTVALFTGIASYIYFGSFYTSNIFFLLPFGILGIVIAFMLAKKSFNLRGVQKPIIIYTLFVVLVFLVVKFDLTGFERRLPDAESVASIEIPNRSYYSKDGFYPGDNSQYFIYEDAYKAEFTDFADIENIIALHAYKIENREKANFSDFFVVKYNLKNGKILEREYYVNNYTDKDYLEKIYTSKNYRGLMFELANGLERELISVDIFDERLNIPVTYNIYNDKEMIEKIEKALIKDMLETPYSGLPQIYNHEGLFPTNIAFSFNVPGHYENEKLKETTARRDITYTIYPSYKNTWKVLEEIGFAKSLPTYEDVAEIGVDINDFKTRWDDKVVTREQSAYIDGYSYMYKITEPSEIKAIYEWVFSDKIIYPEHHEGTKNVNLTFVFKNGHALNHSFSFSEELWPDELKSIY